MVPMAEVVTAILLAALFVWWFRRTSSYKSRRRYRGGVPGQWTSPGPTFYGQRTNVPAAQPELRSEAGLGRRPGWHRRRGSTQPKSRRTT
jgi:hypothetical protein